MKIGVVTYWYGNSNYGMMMQCWALQKYLKQLGHDPYVIRFAKKAQEGMVRRTLKYLGIFNMCRRIKCVLDGSEYVESSYNNSLRKFEEFRQTHINLSINKYSTISELQNNPPIADCYITGSDQVWSQLLNDDNNTAYFLNFGSNSIKRIAYAPSFSMKKYPDNLQERLSTMLKKLDYISAREYDGVKICELLGFAAKKVLDPTLLLEKQDYLELCKKIPAPDTDCIFIYSLNISDPEDIRWTELQSFASNRNYQVIVTPADGYITGGEIFVNSVTYCYSTIEKWIALIRDAKLIVTSSFHGIVLSIILERPFVYVPLKGQLSSGNNRVLDLLKDLNLESRILSESRSYSKISKSIIDWNLVKKHLEINIRESKDYICTALSVS